MKLNASTVYDVEIKFRESLTPSCELARNVGKILYPLAVVAIRAYCETILFEVRAQEKHIPYNC